MWERWHSIDRLLTPCWVQEIGASMQQLLQTLQQLLLVGSIWNACRETRTDTAFTFHDSTVKCNRVLLEYWARDFLRQLIVEQWANYPGFMESNSLLLCSQERVTTAYLSHINPPYIITLFFSEINCNVILQSMLSKCCLLFGFMIQNFSCISYLQYTCCMLCQTTPR